MARPVNLADFWQFVQKGEGCWEWQGTLTKAHGYGRFGSKNLAHRLAYELAKGPIPAGLVIDHLCRNHRCVRPDHLEAVTDRVNILRGQAPSVIASRSSVCKNGHPYDADNTRLSIIRATGRVRRRCRICTRVLDERQRRRMGKLPLAERLALRRQERPYPELVIGRDGA